MAIKSHRQTKLRDQCVLLRFYCENAKKKSGSCGDSARSNRKYETASGWSGIRLFIFRLKSAQKRKEAKTGAARRMNELELSSVDEGGTWVAEGGSQSFPRFMAILHGATPHQVNAQFMRKNTNRAHEKKKLEFNWIRCGKMCFNCLSRSIISKVHPFLTSGWTIEGVVYPVETINGQILTPLVSHWSIENVFCCWQHFIK